MLNKNQTIILGIVATLLLLPLIAMQFTTEVDWSISDFVIAGLLLGGTGLLCELLWRKVKVFKHRLLLIGLVLLALLLVWIELAVGLFGSPIAGS